MDKELKHTIDFINQKTGKKTGFSTPNNYFNEIETSIQNTILNELTVEKSKEIKIISLYEKILQFIPVSAVASILLFISLNTKKINAFDDITVTDISLWYENGYGTTTNEEIAIILDASNFDDTDILLSINTKNLEDYLNTIDNTTLLNEIQ